MSNELSDGCEDVECFTPVKELRDSAGGGNTVGAPETKLVLNTLTPSPSTPLSEPATTSQMSNDALLSVAVLEQEMKELHATSSEVNVQVLSADESLEFAKWQASMVERCMRNKWFPTKTLNRVVAPFALSMTTVMLQKLSGERTLKQLEAFTNLHLFDRTKIQEGIGVMTGIFKDFTEITKKLQQGETDKTDCTNENLRRIRLVTKEIGVMMTYTLLITKHAKIPENIEKFYQHVCHEEVKRADFKNAKKVSEYLLEFMSIVANLNLHEEFVQARQARHCHKKADMLMPIPKLCSKESQLIAMTGTRLRAFWAAQKVHSYRINKFTLAYNVQQEHFFFGLDISARVIAYSTFDACALPLIVAKSVANDFAGQAFQFRLILIRPYCIGSLRDLYTSMSGEVIIDLLQRLSAEEEKDVSVLLPYVDISSSTERFLPVDLCAIWKASKMKHFSKAVDSTKSGLLALEKFFHYASLRIDDKGVGPAEKLNNNRPCVPEYSSEAETYLKERQTQKDNTRRKERTFNFCYDSPFMYLVVEEDTQLVLLCGSYGGSPALPIDRMHVPNPQSRAINWIKRVQRRKWWCCRKIKKSSVRF